MGTLYTISRATSRHVFRQIIFYLTLLTTLILVYISDKLTLFHFDSQTTMIKEMGISAMVLWGLIMAVLMQAQLVTEEIENRWVMTLLAKPLSRGQYVVAKYAGVLFPIAVGMLLLTFTLLLTVWQTHTSADPEARKRFEHSQDYVTHTAQEGYEVVEGQSLEFLATAVYGKASYSKFIVERNPGMPTDLKAPISPGTIITFPSVSLWQHRRMVFWEYYAFGELVPILEASFLAFLQVALLAAIAMILSVQFNLTLSGVGTFFVYVLGHLQDYITATMLDSGSFLLAGAAHLMRLLLPNLENFNVLYIGGNPGNISMSHFFTVAAYSMLYTFGALYLSSLIFARKEIK